MRHLARTYSRHPEIRRLAMRIVERLPERDRVAEARALRDWWRANVRFVRDIDGLETVATPLSTLTTRQGDCDDYSTALAATLLSLGNDEVYFKVIDTGSGTFSHVYVAVRIGDNLIPLDASDSRYPAGTEASHVRARIVKV